MSVSSPRSFAHLLSCLLIASLAACVAYPHREAPTTPPQAPSLPDDSYKTVGALINHFDPLGVIVMISSKVDGPIYRPLAQDWCLKVIGNHCLTAACQPLGDKYLLAVVVDKEPAFSAKSGAHYDVPPYSDGTGIGVQFWNWDDVGVEFMIRSDSALPNSSKAPFALLQGYHRPSGREQGHSIEYYGGQTPPAGAAAVSTGGFVGVIMQPTLVTKVKQ